MDLNLKDDVGVGHGYYPFVEIYGGLGKHHLSLIYTQADYSGSNILFKDISFNDTNFLKGVLVDTEISR